MPLQLVQCNTCACHAYKTVCFNCLENQLKRQNKALLLIIQRRLIAQLSTNPAFQAVDALEMLNAEIAKIEI